MWLTGILNIAKGNWIYIILGAALLGLFTVMQLRVGALKNELLEQTIKITEQEAEIARLKTEVNNCSSALHSSQNNVDLLSSELIKANDRYKEFEIDKEKTKKKSDEAIQELQDKVIQLQNDAVELKKKYAKKSDSEILELMKKDVNKTIDAVRAINILFDQN